MVYIKLVKKHRLGISLVTAVSFFMLGLAGVSSVSANEYGTDTSRYQGYSVLKGRADDSYNVAQIGGYTNGYYYDQATYKSQISSGIAQGLYEHTYIWMESGANSQQAVNVVNHFLPKVQTPKGSVIALDVEAGYSGAYKQANTNAIIAGLNRIKQAGYTPVLYTGKSYINSVAYPSQIVAKFGKVLWLAQYPTMQVTQTPNYNYAPVMDGYNSWQYSSMGRPQGLDMNVAFTNVWHSGYDGTYKPSKGGTVANPKGNNAKQPSAVKQGLKANSSAKKVGSTVKVNFRASRWSNGLSIPSWVKGKSYKVIQVSGNKVLLGGIMSWINKSDVEVTLTPSQTTSAQNRITWVSDKQTYRLKNSINLRTTPSTNAGIIAVLPAGSTVVTDKATISGGYHWARQSRSGGKYGYLATGPANSGLQYVSRTGVTNRYTVRTYTVIKNDNLSTIANKLHTSVSHLLSTNSLKNGGNLIYPGEKLVY